MIQDITDMTGAELREAIHSVVTEAGYSYEQLAEHAEPLITECNRRGEALAKKYGKKFRPLTFTEARNNAII